MGSARATMVASRADRNMESPSAETAIHLHLYQIPA